MGNMFGSEEEACNRAMEDSKKDRFKCTYYVMKKTGRDLIAVNEMLLYQLRKDRWSTVAAYKEGGQLI